MQLAAVHKLDFRLIMNKRKLRPAVAQTHVFDRIYTFSFTVFASVMGLYIKCAGQLHSLGKMNVNYLLVKTSAVNLGNTRMAHSGLSKTCYFVCSFN